MDRFYILICFALVITLLFMELGLFKNYNGTPRFRLFTMISSLVIFATGLLLMLKLGISWLFFIYMGTYIVNSNTGIWSGEYPKTFLTSRIVSIIIFFTTYIYITG